MSAQAHNPTLQPFYLPAAIGERFCIYHPAHGIQRGAIVYVHPFAEEMNKSRRLVATQCRLLAAQGYAVLQIDLFGCGDSSGDFGAARWDIWKEDVALAVQWMKRRVTGPIHLWGLRLGALLALDSVAITDANIGGFLLWQPVVSGVSFITQFLRVRVASESMFGAGKATTTHLREQLASRVTLEIAGYDLAPGLAHSIEHLRIAEFDPPAPVHWIEIVTEPGHGLAPASRTTVENWLLRGIAVQASVVVGEPFWNTVEIADSPQLLAETCSMLQRVYA